LESYLCDINHTDCKEFKRDIFLVTIADGLGNHIKIINRKTKNIVSCIRFGNCRSRVMKIFPIQGMKHHAIVKENNFIHFVNLSDIKKAFLFEDMDTRIIYTDKDWKE
jgi:hypothetical protein